MAVTMQYVEVSEEVKAKMQVYRDKFDALYQEISTNVEGSRGKSLALTHLEEASMWLNKGLTGNC